MIGLWLGLALAGTANSVEGAAIADALAEELERSQEKLELPEAPPIHHLRYQLGMLHQVDAVADRGGLVRWSSGPANAIGVEVRVGTPEFDNTGFGGWQNGFLQTGLPDELTPLSARLGAWRITDKAYKQAVEQYARKEAQFTPPDDYPGDYQLTGAVEASQPVPDPEDPEPLVELTRRLSARFADSPHRLERGEVHLGHETGALWTVDTEGTRVSRSVAETTIRAFAQLRTDDGMLLTDHRLWSERSPDRLLDEVDAAEAEIDAMVTHLVDVARAPVLPEEYVGPVLFEHTAAADLFRYLLVDQLEGTPPEIPFDSWFGDLGSSKDPVRIGRRVLPRGWRVWDDPTAEFVVPAGFTHDLEGTPAEKVELVEDGIVRDVLMSRVPRKGVDGTNGHARGTLGDRAEGRATQVFVQPPKTQSAKAVHKRALREARSYGRDWYLAIERLQEPAVRSAGQGFSVWSESTSGGLPPPVAVFKVHADGQRDLLRGAAIVGAERWLLRDILASGELGQSTWMAATGAYGSGTTLGLPTTLRGPDVLVGEVEVVPAPGDPRDAPLLDGNRWLPSAVRATAPSNAE